MDKAKLKWNTKVPKSSGELECQFNPSELSICKKNDWGEDEKLSDWNSRPLKFGGGLPATYSLSLFFDSYSAEKGTPRDVRTHTNRLLKLTLRGVGRSVNSDENADPPLVTFIWGKITLFTAVITDVTITYTMFAQNGTPIRAKATVNFKQNDESDDKVPAQNPSSRTDSRRTRIAFSGQRLDHIAYEEYGDTRFWRLLAESNYIDDPFHLTDGQILVIPQTDLE